MLGGNLGSLLYGDVSVMTTVAFSAIDNLYFGFLFEGVPLGKGCAIFEPRSE